MVTTSAGPDIPDHTGRSGFLPPDHSASMREALIGLLHRGASPAAACGQLGLQLAQYLAWLDDPAFQIRLTESRGVLSQNVAAALYRSAMEGSVSAQTFYLKHLPPPEWPAAEASAPPPDPNLNKLTDAELLERFRTRCADLPPEDVGNDSPPISGPQSE